MGGGSHGKLVATTTPRRRGSRGVGEQVFTEVEQLTAGGAMKRGAAIAMVAEKLGSNTGTVAANYYRIARRRGIALRPRLSGTTKKGRGSSGALSSALATIQDVLRSQGQEIEKLREDNRKLEQLRRLLA
jgi:hypothetical protein